LHLQLQPGGAHRGVLHAGMPLLQLHLDHCGLIDGDEGLAAALLLLPRLEHLSITECSSGGDTYETLVCSAPCTVCNILRTWS
jgi:hypothetical protein